MLLEQGTLNMLKDQRYFRKWVSSKMAKLAIKEKSRHISNPLKKNLVTFIYNFHVK